MGEPQGHGAGNHLEKDVGTRQEAKGMAWPGKTCNERQKGLSREMVKRQFQHLQELKDLPSKVELVLCSLAGLSSFVEHPRRTAAGDRAISVI